MLHRHYPASTLLWATPTPIRSDALVMTSQNPLVHTNRYGSDRTNGSPGFPVHSFGTRSLQPPRPILRVHTLITSPQITGFNISGSLAIGKQRNEAESSSLALGLAPSSSGRDHPPSPNHGGFDRNVSHALLPPHAEARLIDE